MSPAQVTAQAAAQTVDQTAAQTAALARSVVQPKMHSYFNSIDPRSTLLPAQ
jgi:hypothetical protein